MRVPIDGPSLRKLRKLQQVQLTDLARAVDMTVSGLCHIERGTRQTVSRSTFAVLVRELDIVERPDWLMPPSGVEMPEQRGTASRLPCSTSSGIIGGRSTSPERPTAA